MARGTGGLQHGQRGLRATINTHIVTLFFLYLAGAWIWMKSNLNVAWLWLALKVPQNLTNLYNDQPLGLVDAYAQLDATVAEAYE